MTLVPMPISARRLATLAVALIVPLAVLALIASGEADAKEARFSQRAYLTQNATNGHTVWIAAHRKGGKGYVSILADSLEMDAARYTVRGKVNNKRISADFGAFGKVNIKLRQIGRARTYSSLGCKKFGKAKLTSRSFRATGTIRFRGEDDYTTFYETAGKGRMEKAWDFGRDDLNGAARRCFEDYDNLKPKLKDGFVELRVDGPIDPEADPRGGRFALSVVRQASFYGTTEVGINIFDSVGKVDITRFAWLEMRSGAFSFDKFLDNGTFRGGENVSGTGLFSRAGTPDQWTGDLTANMPGRPDIPLVGPGAVAKLRPALRYGPSVELFPSEEDW